MPDGGRNGLPPGVVQRLYGLCTLGRQSPESRGLNAVREAENRCAVPVFRLDMASCVRHAPSSDFVNPKGGNLKANQAQDGPRLEGACRGHAAIDQRERDSRNWPDSGGFGVRDRRSSRSSRLTGWVIVLSAPVSATAPASGTGRWSLGDSGHRIAQYRAGGELVHMGPGTGRAATRTCRTATS